MPRSPRRHSVDAFKSSLCPEPGAFTFIAFSILSVLWIFCQICIAFQPKNPAKPPVQKSYDPTGKIIVSAIYAIVLGILLLDGCCFVTLYVWAIKKVSTAPTIGVMDLFSSVLAVVTWCAFLLVLFGSGFWTIRVMIKQMYALWTDGGDNTKMSSSIKPKGLV
ncbi:hypothetical protein F5Y07DRAFT_376487 [Xylaria sp. FL0933]|nr:hypothetical protein F5Y07DRAFT_376487 [Xylaria sp. FL0933]